MKFPAIRAQANLTVKVPGLSGGLNVHDTLSTVEDHQLTSANNVWWKNAALRTRPGMRDTGDTYDISYTDQQWVSDREVLLTSCVYQNSTRAVFSAAKMTQENGFEKIGQGGQSYYAKPVNGKAPTAFGCHAVKSGSEEVDAQSDYLYFLSNGEIIEENKSVDNPAAGAGWVAAEPYVPTLSIAEKAYEAANMLTGAFKSTFIPDGQTVFFQLPLKELTYNTGETITVSFQLVNQVSGELDEYSISIAPSDVQTRSDGTKYAGVSVDIKAENIRSGSTDRISAASAVAWIYYETGKVNLYLLYYDTEVAVDGGRVEMAFPAMSKDSITVTAWKTVSGRREKICKMTQCTWFGNSQLFVCGSPEERNLVHWSDVRNPLYFPENNYVYVGDYSQGVTAMRQQGELLVIFQEHRMHGMTYALADDDTYAYALEAGIDATSIRVQFSLVSIHAAVGCDCPGSIRLVNNRLVWANSDGKVYMLPSVNQYNERNVREISRNIFPLLSQHSADALKASFAGEFGGYYVLLVENIMYLLDAQTSAFTSFNYYSKEENAQKALPWFRWTLPKADYVHLMANDTVMYLSVTADGSGRVYALDNDTDNGAPIACSFTTKMFDFDRPDKKKAVNQMYISIGDSPESTVDISYITEYDEYTDAWSMESFGDYDEREPGFMRVHRLTPNVSRARVFGFRCDSVGAVAIGDILLKFKEQGVVR